MTRLFQFASSPTARRDSRPRNCQAPTCAPHPLREVRWAGKGSGCSGSERDPPEGPAWVLPRPASIWTGDRCVRATAAGSAALRAPVRRSRSAGRQLEHHGGRRCVNGYVIVVASLVGPIPVEGPRVREGGARRYAEALESLPANSPSSSSDGAIRVMGVRSRGFLTTRPQTGPAG